MAYNPRPTGTWVDNVSELLAEDANRWETNQKDSSDRITTTNERIDGIADRATALEGGKADVEHTHTVDEIAATGPRSELTYLRGDGVWEVPPGSGESDGSVPAGGATGQVLTKTGPGDFAMAWANVPGGAGGSGLGGIVDCSAMTTAADINAASLAAGAGSIIWLGRRPSSAPLVLEATLVLRPYQKIMGGGGRTRLTNLQAGPAFPAGQPLVAAAGYLANQTFADSPASVVGVHLDANGKLGSHGLVVYNFWSHFEDIQVANVAGPTAHGIHATDRGIGGTAVSTNSHSENTFVRLRMDSFINGAHGFWAESTNGLNNSNQDGHLVDSFFASIPGYAIMVTRAAGWTVHNNHTYAIGSTAIRLQNCYATKVTNNYIEDFGENDASGAYYSGISLDTVLDTRASIVANNTVSTSQASATVSNRFACFYARAGSGQLRANVVFVGNTATFAGGQPTTSRSVAYMLGEGGDTGRMLYVEWAANQIEATGWWQTPRMIAGSTVTLTEATGGGGGTTDASAITSGTLSPDRLPRQLAVRATLTLNNATMGLDVADETFPLFVDLTLTGPGSVAVPTGTPEPGLSYEINALASGANRVLTFADEFRLGASVPSRAITISNGQALLSEIEYSSLLSAWVITRAQLTTGTGGATGPLSAGSDATLAPNATLSRTATEPAGSTPSARKWEIVSGPMGSGTTISTAAAVAWVPGSSPAGTTDIRQPEIMEMAFEMTSTAENSRTDWYALTNGPAGQAPPYVYCEDIFDGRGYTAGIVGFCSATGDMLELVQNYVTAKPTGNALAQYVSGLQTCTDIGTSDGDYVSDGGAASDAAAENLGPAFISAWQNAAMNDPIFRRVQREYRKAHYWDDALTQALADGVGPLGMCIYYDILVNHGPGNDSESFGGIISYVRTNSAASRPSTGSAPNQATWLNALTDRRNTILQGWGDDQATDGRVFMHRGLITGGNFNLTGNVAWTCYADNFSFNRPQPTAETRTGTYILRYTATGVGTDDVTVTVA